MSKLFKKKIVTEELYLEEGGKVFVTEDESRMPQSQRFKVALTKDIASTYNIVGYGRTLSLALTNFGVSLAGNISSTEHNINGHKKMLKGNIRHLRNMRLIKVELENYKEKAK